MWPEMSKTSCKKEKRTAQDSDSNFESHFFSQKHAENLKAFACALDDAQLVGSGESDVSEGPKQMLTTSAEDSEIWHEKQFYVRECYKEIAYVEGEAFQNVFAGVFGDLASLPRQ